MSEIESSMNFFDHIKGLRQKLLYVIIFFLITFIVSFYFSQSIFEFLAKPLTSILGEGNGLIYTALQEAFLTNVKVAFFTAAFISFPFLSIQIWSFVCPVEGNCMRDIRGIVNLQFRLTRLTSLAALFCG